MSNVISATFCDFKQICLHAQCSVPEYLDSSFLMAKNIVRYKKW